MAIVPVLRMSNLLCTIRTSIYFLIERKSKLRRGSSLEPLVTAFREYVGGLDSVPGWILWVVDTRPTLDTNRLDRPSVKSPEELGLLLLVTAALFEELPFREVRAFSESASCQTQVHKVNSNALIINN